MYMKMKYCIKLVNGKLVEISKEDYESYLTLTHFGWLFYSTYDDEFGSVKVVEKVRSID